MLPRGSMKWSTFRQFASGVAGVAVVAATLAWGRSLLGPADAPKPARPEGPAVAWPVHIRRPAGPPTIATGLVDERGTPIRIACATCHATKPTNPDARVGAALRQFHQTLVGNHGNLTCVSCHNPADGHGSLRLADSRSVPFTEVMTLCAQCHGTQYRDYQHGAHGGMTGYWDLTRGGRSRNNCVDCHDPHAPKYPTVTPAPGPNDRFLNGGGHE